MSGSGVNDRDRVSESYGYSYGQELKSEVRLMPVSLQELSSLEKDLISLEELVRKKGFVEKLTELEESLRSLSMNSFTGSSPSGGVELHSKIGELLKRKTYLERILDELRSLRSDIEILKGLYDDAIEDPSTAEEWLDVYNSAVKRISSLRISFLLSDELDMSDAILMLHAGTGGTDAQDWTDMLFRMYLSWARRRGFSVKVLDVQYGNEAGIKSATIQISGPNAYGLLKGEAGAHRLVRLSPFNANNKRQTSFALVEVIPRIEDDIKVEIRPEDLKVETFRAGGHGGQHVNRNETAVRITHLPTGISVVCSNERSQHQNREIALRILRSRLYQLEKKRREEEVRQLKGHHKATWGNQIRNYVLHPYRLVKDLRTGYSTSKVDEVLAGDIDEFIYRWLAWKNLQEG